MLCSAHCFGSIQERSSLNNPKSPSNNDGAGLPPERPRRRTRGIQYHGALSPVAILNIKAEGYKTELELNKFTAALDSIPSLESMLLPLFLPLVRRLPLMTNEGNRTMMIVGTIPKKERRTR